MFLGKEVGFFGLPVKAIYVFYYGYNPNNLGKPKKKKTILVRAENNNWYD